MEEEKIGKRIRDRRKELGISAVELASFLGMSKATIHRYESGDIRKIKLPVIESIADVLKVNPSWLIGKSDQKYDEPLSKDNAYKDVRRIIVDVQSFLRDMDVLIWGGRHYSDEDRDLLVMMLDSYVRSIDGKYR